NLRIFEDSEGKMNLSLVDIGGELLIVSQFTLYGDCRKGRRPNFMEALSGEEANKLYEAFVEQCKKEGLKVKTGVFGANMEVNIVNDGPVTLLIDSKKNF
ncbi:MAG TPA: D-tyrosyl-tRNA(Tyr) deacylase, partial [Clostridium sp.]|nr:D-tyrosyl-tRNA(Tyr) deacylase [Clostridium sp.]